MKQRTNLFVTCGHWLAKKARDLREWIRPHVRVVRRHMIRGASYALGSGAVSLIIVWVQSRY